MKDSANRRWDQCRVEALSAIMNLGASTADEVYLAQNKEEGHFCPTWLPGKSSPLLVRGVGI